MSKYFDKLVKRLEGLTLDEVSINNSKVIARDIIAVDIINSVYYKKVRVPLDIREANKILDIMREPNRKQRNMETQIQEEKDELILKELLTE